jgi:hypothetical protein
VARVLPLAGGEVRTRLEPAAVAAVFIKPTVDDRCHKRPVRRRYIRPDAGRDTDADKGALGHTVAEAAADLGVSPTTARTHLDTVFAKTGVSRQSEHIRLAGRFTSAAASFRHDRVVLRRLRSERAALRNNKVDPSEPVRGQIKSAKHLASRWMPAWQMCFGGSMRASV